MDSDEAEKLEAVKTFLVKNKMNWTQTQFTGIKDLIETGYRISGIRRRFCSDRTARC